MSEEVLKVENLKTYFFQASGISKAVDGVSFTLKKGETMGIVGESGSGKSVTSSSIMRLLPAKTGKIVDGSILFQGTDIRSLNKKEILSFRGNDFAMIFQNPMTSLDPVFKVGRQMTEMILAHRKISKKEAWDIAVDALRQVGIPEPEKRMNAYPHELSGGMCQRVIIAMAVCSNPKLIIADEPTTALDVTVQAQVLELLRTLQEKNGTSILLITHNLGVVWEMCDTVMVMYAGQTVEYASCEALYSEPLHPYTWGLLDSMPKLSSDSRAELRTIPGVPPDLRLTGSCCNFYNRCPYCTDICRAQVPPLREVSAGHFVACHRQGKEERLTRGGTSDEQ
jgi:oligopeptide transport system ATP-binding protein